MTAGVQDALDALDALDAGASAFLVGIADDELLTGHVLTSVAGWGPELELNIAMSSIGQDELGHARRLYEHLLGDPAAAERFVYDRPAAEFRATPLARTYPRRWEAVLVRQYLYETADAARTEVLAASGRPEIAGLFGEFVHEERYHLDFWDTWLRATVGKGDEGGRRVQCALDELWPIALDSFGPAASAVDGRALGVAAGALADAFESWTGGVRTVMAGLGVEVHDEGPATVPDALDALLDEMRCVYRTAPGSW